MAAALPTTQVGAQTVAALPTQIGGTTMPGVQTMPAVQYAGAPTYTYLNPSQPYTTYAGGMASLPTSTWIQPAVTTVSPQALPVTSVPATSVPATSMPTTVAASQYGQYVMPTYTYPVYPGASYPMVSASAPQNLPTTIVANPAEAGIAPAPSEQPVVAEVQAAAVTSNVSATPLVQAAPTPTNTPVMQSVGTASSGVMQSLGAANTPVTQMQPMQSQSPMAQSFVMVGTPQAMLTSLPAGSPVASTPQGFPQMSLPATSASVPMDPATSLGASRPESEVKTQSKDLRKPGKKPKKGKNKFGCCGC